MPYHTLASSLPFLSTLFSSTLHSFLIPIFPLFFFIFLSSYFPHLFFLTFYLPIIVLVVAYCKHLRPFYTAYCEEFYCFTPQLLLAWCRRPSQTTNWSVSCSTITTTLYWPRHVPFLDKRVLFCFLAFRSIPI